MKEQSLKRLMKFYEHFPDVLFSTVNLFVYIKVFKQIIQSESLVAYFALHGNGGYGPILTFTNNFGLYLCIIGVALSVLRIFKGFDRQIPYFFNYLLLLIFMVAYGEFSFSLMDFL